MREDAVPYFKTTLTPLLIIVLLLFFFFTPIIITVVIMILSLHLPLNGYIRLKTPFSPSLPDPPPAWDITILLCRCPLRAWTTLRRKQLWSKKHICVVPVSTTYIVQIWYTQFMYCIFLSTKTTTTKMSCTMSVLTLNEFCMLTVWYERMASCSEIIIKIVVMLISLIPPPPQPLLSGNNNNR